jgi:Na+/proline symporter
MIVAMAVLPMILIWKIGGPHVFWTKIAADSASSTLTDPFAGKTGLALIGFLALWLGVPLGNPGQPHVLVRLMAVKDKRAVFRGGVVSSIWVLVLFTGAVMLGISARVYFGHLDDPEQTLPIIASDSNIVPGFLGGMIIAAMMAAICSTADSQLLVAASAVSHDLFVRVFRREATLAQRRILDRSAVLLVGTAATIIAATEARSVFSFVLDYGWAGLGAGFGPALIMSLLWRRTTGWGVLAGMTVGVTTAIVWKQFPELQNQVYNLVPAFLFSLVSIVIVSLLTSFDNASVAKSHKLHDDFVPESYELREGPLRYCTRCGQKVDGYRCSESLGHDEYPDHEKPLEEDAGLSDRDKAYWCSSCQQRWLGVGRQDNGSIWPCGHFMPVYADFCAVCGRKRDSP